MNAKQGCTAVLTSKGEMENYLHPDAIFAARAIRLSFGDFDDVPEMAARGVHENSGSGRPWDDLEPGDRNKKQSRAKLWLNTEAASMMTPHLAARDLWGFMQVAAIKNHQP
jgi:hypothetical protein